VDARHDRARLGVVDFTGRRAIVPVEATGNESPSSTTDGGTLVDPQIDTEQDAIIAIRYHDGGLELTDALVRQATGNNAGAFVNKLDRSSKKLAASMRKNLNRQVFGDGTGLLATLASSPAASTTVTVTDDAVPPHEHGRRRAEQDDGRHDRRPRPDDHRDQPHHEGGHAVGGDHRRRRPRTASTSRAPATTSRTACATSPATGRTLHGINSATAGNEFWNGAERDAARRSPARASSSCSPTTSARTARATSRCS
jgi:hypothetical protein